MICCSQATPTHKYKCPVCGFEEDLYSCSTTMVVTVDRKPSIQEVQCYQKLYGRLVTVVDHYKQGGICGEEAVQ